MRLPARSSAAGGGLAVTNLLVDLDELGSLLNDAVCRRDWLDAFLLAAGINQIVEDCLHEAPYPLDDAGLLLSKGASPVAHLAGRALAGSARGLRYLDGRFHDAKRVLAWQGQVAAVVDDLADVVIAYAEGPPELIDRCRRLALQTAYLPARERTAVVRVPACFHNFDQRPEDLMRLAQRFTDRWPEADRPPLVVGVRTSGSYLAPLLAASLRARGRSQASVMTIRPGRVLLAPERCRVRRQASRGGQVLLIDDPPVTGASIAHAARAVQRLGIANDSIVVVLGLAADSDDPPPKLAEYHAVTLASQEWTANLRLDPRAVRSALEELLDGELELHSLEQLPLGGAGPSRGHRRARFRVRGLDRTEGNACQLDVLATTVGCGYLGAHELAVSETLGAFTPRTLGLRDGVLYREWLPGERRIAPDAPELPSAVASYVAARRRLLPVGRDMSIAMAGQDPLWEVVASMLGRGFAGAAPLARILLVNRIVRRLLAVAEPSVVDGRMTPEHWFTGEHGLSPIKVSLGDRTYWNRGLACFDATFDLTGAAPSHLGGTLASDVRAAWERETGEQIEAGRWLLYELAHQWGRAQESRPREADVRNACARAAASYFADRFIADLDPAEAGPVCALDIDGVLESEQFGFSMLTRASATALRALLAHGYRPVPVTGRGLAEVRDRCRAYGLIGGVAEYGSALWLAEGDRMVQLLNPASSRALDRLRTILREQDDVMLDPAYVCAVRAYRIDAGGARTPLRAAEAPAFVQACGGPRAIRDIPGDGQTDFVAADVDKASGLRALLRALAEGSDAVHLRAPEVALSVGDTAEDAPIHALASASFVPAHADIAAVGSTASRVSRPYQAGLSQAVEWLLGHRPGTCAGCRVPPAAPEDELLLDLLSVAEDGRLGIALGALKLAWKMR
jgi:adenine/guanine phosphoribosyltransferase-like PRPP-binding protein/hydroxymethylpyrimidine pyrophosphatase-like HAD family hydrolase